MATRDFVWLRPVIQTRDFLPQRDLKDRFRIHSSHQGFPQIFTLYEIPRILKGTSYPPDRKTCNPERNRPPRKCKPSYDLGSLSAQHVPVRVRNGRDSRSDGNHVRWPQKKLGHLLGCARIKYRQVGSPSTRDSGDQVLAATSSVHPHAHKDLSSWILPLVPRPLITCCKCSVKIQREGPMIHNSMSSRF